MVFSLPLILWQSYETALEMHEGMYRARCPVYGRPSSGFFSGYSITFVWRRGIPSIA